MLFSEVDVDRVWDQSEGVKGGSGQWVGELHKRVPEHDLWDAKKSLSRMTSDDDGTFTAV